MFDQDESSFFKNPFLRNKEVGENEEETQSTIGHKTLLSFRVLNVTK